MPFMSYPPLNLTKIILQIMWFTSLVTVVYLVTVLLTIKAGKLKTEIWILDTTVLKLSYYFWVVVYCWMIPRPYKPDDLEEQCTEVQIEIKRSSNLWSWVCIHILYSNYGFFGLPTLCIMKYLPFFYVYVK